MIAKADFAAGALELSGLGPLLRSARDLRGVLVLAYHRIGDGSRSPFDRALYSATPEAFDAQVRTLKRHFDVIGPPDLRDALARGRGNYAMITFDDGYRDNFDVALPILRHHRVAATFFLSTGFIERPRLAWWDEIAWMVRRSCAVALPPSPWWPCELIFDPPDRSRVIHTLLHIYRTRCEAEPEPFLNLLAEQTGSGRCDAKQAAQAWLNWDMVRQLRDAGMWIGGHTVTHAILAQLSPQRQRHEIAGCRRHLQQHLGLPMRWFSYPRGKGDSFDPRTVACLREQGVELAFSYYGGLCRAEDWDPYDVRRVAVESDIGARRFDAMLALPEVFA